MIDVKDKNVKSCLFEANFGIEKESMRVYEDGFLSKSAHPFAGNKKLSRDFSENQLEIITSAHKSVKSCINELDFLTKEAMKTLYNLDKKEFLWFFSNPPIINDESDLPIAQFFGEEAKNTTYREYLSDTYGRYKMALSGIHINFSFSDDLVNILAKNNNEKDVQSFKDKLYLKLAINALNYGFLLTALTSASPVIDSSYLDSKLKNKTLFLGLSSIRVSELGYWNYFTPVFDFSSAKNYASAMQDYIKEGLITSLSELYHPIRLKPYGVNNYENLTKGISHIELRMVDINPYVFYGVYERDIEFIHLFMIYLACIKTEKSSKNAQIQAVQNFKLAAHFDLTTVKTKVSDKNHKNCLETCIAILDDMKDFFVESDLINLTNTSENSNKYDILDLIEYQRKKLTNRDFSYAKRVFDDYNSDFFNKALKLSLERTKEII